MKLLRVDFDKKQQNFTMPSPHAHNQYELYFLLQGTREILLQNAVFNILPQTLCVIPPFCLHKTSGGPHAKINVYISKDLLNEKEIEFLNTCSALKAIKLDKKYLSSCISLLKIAAGLTLKTANVEEYQLAITKSLLLILQQQDLKSAINSSSMCDNITLFEPLILDIVQYIEKHYAEKITLSDICNQFFLSKATLCRRFNNSMNCSVMEYLLRLRISKAKQLLTTTEQSIEKIAISCGFSSANYFGLIFKERVGKSPLQYRKEPN